MYYVGEWSVGNLTPFRLHFSLSLLLGLSSLLLFVWRGCLYGEEEEVGEARKKEGDEGEGVTP